MASRGVIKNNTGVVIRSNDQALDELKKALVAMSKIEVLVGVPDANSDRDPDAEQKEDITNAALAFIHDQGAPEANIPARPFMLPGIRAVQAQLTDKLGQTMRAVLKSGGLPKVEQGFAQVGILAAVSIQKTINDGIPPPLSEATLRQRMKKGRKNGAGARKGAAQELDRRWDGQAPSTEFAKPLVDTAQLRNSITYAIRDKKARKR